MKKQVLAVATLMLFAIMPACKKDSTTPANTNGNNTNNNNNNQTTYFFKAKINGVLYEGASSYATAMPSGTMIGTTITFEGVKTAFIVIANDYSGVKTYDDENSEIKLGDTGYGYSDFVGGNTTVKITSDDSKTIKGEFSGKIYSFEDDTKFVDITEGSFTAKWSGQ